MLKVHPEEVELDEFPEAEPEEEEEEPEKAEPYVASYVTSPLGLFRNVRLADFWLSGITYVPGILVISE